MTLICVRDWQDADSWNRCLDGAGTATFYQRFEWREMYRDVFRQPTHYLGAECGGTLAGVLPLVLLRTFRGERMLVSLPYVNYAGICAGDPDTAVALWRRAASLAEETGCQWIELRGIAPAPLGAGEVVSRHKIREYLPLPDDPQALWKGYPAKLRSQVKRAWKNGLEARWGGRELLPDFYSIYLRNMRFLGSPPLPKACFEWLGGRFGRQTSVCCVTKGGRTLAAAFLIGFGSTLEVPWAVSRPEGRSSSANMLLYWEMIRFAIESGYRVFDMGRSTPGTGSHRFKEQWGGVSQTLEWVYWRRQSAALPSYTHGNGQMALARRVWSRLPLRMTETLGGRLIRHIPC